MNKWEHFRYILENTLPSYKRWTHLSLERHITNDYFEYVWKLKIKYGSGLYPELISLSKFCGIEWEHMTYTEMDGGYTIIETTEINREPIKPVYW